MGARSISDESRFDTQSATLCFETAVFRAAQDERGVSAATTRLDRVPHHRYPYSLRGAHARRSFRCRGDAASNPSGQKRGDELSRTTRGVLSRDVGFRPPAGGLRKGRHHRPDHQQSIRGRGDRIDFEQARDRCRQARQRPERRGRCACTSDQLGSGHAQSARREPYRRRRTLPRAARLRGPSDHVELHGQFLDTEAAFPFWEWAQDREVPIFIHPPRVPIGHDQQMDQYKLDELVGRPFDTAMALARMILSGLFDRYPRLKIAVAHMGGGLLPVMGRLDFG
jgi:hypothetical protein